MITLENLIINLEKVYNINEYIKYHKKQFLKCAIIDDMPFKIENAYTYGTGILAILDYHLNQDGINIEPEVFKFIHDFEDSELLIEYDWEAEGHFNGQYIPSSDYWTPEEFPEWELDEFKLIEVRVINSNNDVVFIVPEQYHYLIQILIDINSISERLKEYESEQYDNYEYDDQD